MKTTDGGRIVAPMTAGATAVETSPTPRRPAPGRWRIDPGHAEVGFVGRHLVFTKVRGRFLGVEGHVEVRPDLSESSVEVAIDMSTVDSGDRSRDDHLRSEDLFDVVAHPEARFRSTRVDWDGDGGTGRVHGELTIKGVTRPVVLDAEFLGSLDDPWGNERAVFSARGKVDREDWGINWNVALEVGGLLVSKEIDLEIEVETIRDGS